MNQNLIKKSFMKKNLMTSHTLLKSALLGLFASTVAFSSFAAEQGGNLYLLKSVLFLKASQPLLRIYPVG